MSAPDFRTRRGPDGQWLVDGWSSMYGWESLPGSWPTKRAAIESTRPAPLFCERHWSWLCGSACPNDSVRGRSLT